MTDGTLVKLDNGSTAQFKRVPVQGAPHLLMLVAVELPSDARPLTAPAS